MASFLTNDTLFSTYIQIKDSGSSNKIILQSPSIASDYTYSLPPNYGSNNQVLSTNGSGTLSWTDNGVISISGTTNRITVTGTSNAVIDIAATYVGQTSITTLGTITSGTWNGSIIGGTYGGTGINNGSSTITIAGNLSTASALSIGTAATVNQLFYTSATNTLSGLTNQINSGLLTDGSGNISWVTVTGTGAPVLANSPILITPNIGVANGTSLSLTSTTAATSSATGSIITAGGVGIGKNIWVGAAFTAANTTTDGSIINIPSFTYTCSTSNPSNVNISSVGSVTINSSSTSTVTSAASHYINGPPIAGTNTTITNPLALRVNTGNVATGGNLTTSGTYNNNNFVNTIGNSTNILYNEKSTGTFVQQTVSIAVPLNKSTMYNDSTIACPIDGGIGIFIKTYDSSGKVQYTQQGPTLTGTGATNNNYTSVSLYNNTLAFGNSTDNSNIGAVWVFERSGTTWVEQTPTKLVGTGATGSAGQGTSVSVYGDTLVIGGPSDNLNTGAAWVFTRSGTTWTQQGTKLVGTGATGAARQGVVLSLYENTFAVSGVNDNLFLGATWVFIRNGSTWTQQGSKLVGSLNSGQSSQGTSISLFKDTLAIGGPDDDSGVGAVWIFTRSNDVWTQQGSKLVGTGAIGPSRQGESVSINENTIATVGGGDNGDEGAVWIFRRSGTTWTQQGSKLTITRIFSGTTYTSITLGTEGNFVVSNIGDMCTFQENTSNSITSSPNIQWSNTSSTLNIYGTLTYSGSPFLRYKGIINQSLSIASGQFTLISNTSYFGDPTKFTPTYGGSGSPYPDFANGGFRIAVPGLYYYNISIQYESKNPPARDRYILVTLNGSSTLVLPSSALLNLIQQNALTTAGMYVECNYMIFLNTNDIIKVFAFQTYGSPVSLINDADANVGISIIKIG